MKARTIILALVAACLLGGGGYRLYRLGIDQGMKRASPATGTEPTTAANALNGDRTDPASGRKVLYWHDPMVPGQKFDKPGKSPFMDMDLVPVYADEAGDEGAVSINPRVQQNLGIRTAEVTKSSLAEVVEAVGSVAYNERDLTLVQARSNGFVERLYVRAPLDPVKKGQPLVQLYVPDWVAAQEEYLSVKRMQGAGDAFVDAAQQRMRLAGMNDEQIRLVASSGKVQARMTLTAPISGVVAELTVREGMTVMAGAPLFRLNGLNTVWVYAEVPEGAAAQVRPGNLVEARTPSLPGEAFKGKVSAILPEVNTATRTLKARVELANSGQRLVPGMFATVNFMPASRQEVLTVPTEAIIQTGKRSVVMVAQDNGKYIPVEVETGTEASGKTEIRKGLQAGQKVVTSGQFLIDSEASLRGATARMTEPSTPGESKAANGPTHHGQGKVEDIGKDDITLSHGPIPSLKWGPMTMAFRLPAGGLPKNIAVGDNVAFDIRQTEDGMYEIAAISRVASAGQAMSSGPMADKKSIGKPGTNK